MTQAVAHILEEFEQLSDAQRRELRQAIVARVPISDDLTDEDFRILSVTAALSASRRFGVVTGCVSI